MRTVSLLLLPLLAGAGGLAQDEPTGGVTAEPTAEPTAVDTSRAPLLDHKKLRQAMTRLESEHADLVSLLGVGYSRGGPGGSSPRRIECLRIAAGDLTEGRPAILIVANLDGPLVYTSGIALDIARRLAQGYDTDQAVEELLDTTTIYILPRANPDAAEARFARVLAEVRATGQGVDDDRDGVQGEDPPADVNGDQYVSVMRVPDPEGEWTLDPTDPRVLIQADRSKGERGTWKLVVEGRDLDGDEEVAEDAPLDAEVNRNFAAGFEEHTARAGLYPTHEPETRALCEFVMANADIQLVIVLGEIDNLVREPTSVPDDAPAVKRVPATGLRESDADLLEEIGRRYAKIAPKKTRGSDDDAGTFQRWCYEHRGLLTLSVHPWSVPLDGDPANGDDEHDDEHDAENDEPEGADAGEQAEGDDQDQPEPSEDAKRLAWADEAGLEDFHLGWTPFDHPELGRVEVGGFRPYALIEPPPAERVRIADEQYEFLLEVSGLLARVGLDEVWLSDLGGGLLEVHATAVNDAFLPLLTTWGRRTRSTRPARLDLLLPEGAELLAGARQTLIDDLPGLGGRQELVWLVRGAPPGTIGVRIGTDHAGASQAEPEVKR